MALIVQSVEYFYARVTNASGEAYGLLTQLAEAEVNLLAFSAVPFGEQHVEFTLFPERTEALSKAAAGLGWELAGPQHAVLIQGDDRLGALADIHRCLNEAGVTVYASTGVTDGNGHFGYVVYFRDEDHRNAARAIAAASIKK